MPKSVSLDDVRLVVRQLRDYGGRDAWLAAQDLSQCLSARSRKTSEPFSPPIAPRRATSPAVFCCTRPTTRRASSRDFGIFHEVAAEVVRASERDVASLRSAGFAVNTISRVGEWDRETILPPGRGWRLHLFDAATNKALTLATRTETRDYVDILGRPSVLIAQGLGF